MRLIWRFPVLIGGLVVLATGCGSGNTPPTPSASSAGSSSTIGGPGVSNPLDVSKIANNPCSALTPAQLAPYMGSIRKTSQSQYKNNGTSCLFYPIDSNMPAVGIYVFPNLGGPSALDQSMFPWHVRTSDIAGYPAEHEAHLGVNGPKVGDCESLVAVSDQAAIGVDIDATSSPQYQHYGDSCTPADNLVQQMISNLKSGG